MPVFEKHCWRIRANDELPALVEHLRLREEITTAFILRTVAGGRMDLLAALLAYLWHPFAWAVCCAVAGSGIKRGHTQAHDRGRCVLACGGA